MGEGGRERERWGGREGGDRGGGFCAMKLISN